MSKTDATVATNEKTKTGFYYGYVVVIAGFLIMLASYGAMRTYGVFLKPMSEDLGWNRAMTSGAYSLFMLILGSLYIITGRLNDKFGPRRVMTVCGILVGGGYLLMTRISALWQLYFFYGVIVSVGMSAVFVPLTSTVARWFTRRRGIMTGLLTAGAGAGTLTIPPIATWLISRYSWRASLIFVGIITLVAFVLAGQFLRRDPGQVAGAASHSGENSVDLQTRGLSRRQALGTRQFWMLFSLLVCHLIGQQAVLVHVVPYATDLGLSPIAAANILATIGGMSVLGMLIMSTTSDRVGVKPAFLVNLGLVTVALLWLVFIQGQVWMFYVFAAFFGFAYGGIVALESPAVAELFGLKAHGALMGIIMCGAMVGGAAGALLAGRVFDVFGTYRIAYLICTVLSVAALTILLFLRPVRQEKYV